MNFKKYIISLCPPRFRLPILFYFHKMRGTLDHEIAYLENLITSHKRAIDIGANKGLYSYAFSKFCREVEAFEPQPWSAEIISKSKIPNIKVHNIALSNRHGTQALYIPLVRGAPYPALASFEKSESEHKDIEVSLERLDDYSFQDVSLIKIDVEGHESQVIEGAKQTILREKPILLVEIEQRHLDTKSIESVFKEITELGYEGSFLNNGKFFPLSEFSYDKYQKPFLEDDVNAIFRHKNRGKVNNFIFRPI